MKKWFKVYIGFDPDKYIKVLKVLRPKGCQWFSRTDLDGWRFDPYEVYGLHVTEDKEVLVIATSKGYAEDEVPDYTDDVMIVCDGAQKATDDAQTAKDDADKPDLTLVPLQILYSIAEVRKYGTKKYKDPDNWKKVSAERYRKALLRHCISYIRDPDGKDAESGLPHLWHLACNVAFLCEMEGHDA